MFQMTTDCPFFLFFFFFCLLKQKAELSFIKVTANKIFCTKAYEWTGVLFPYEKCWPKTKQNWANVPRSTKIKAVILAQSRNRSGTQSVEPKTKRNFFFFHLILEILLCGPVKLWELFCSLLYFIKLPPLSDTLIFREITVSLLSPAPFS